MVHRPLNLHKFLLRYLFGGHSSSQSQFLPKHMSFCELKRHNHGFHNHNTIKSIPAGSFPIFRNCRRYSIEIDQEVDRINLKFAEAREEIESAMESKETVYFNEEAECARALVSEVLELYNQLLDKVQEKEKAAIQRSMGLKIEQLKAELARLDE